MCGLAGWFCYGDQRPEVEEIREMWEAQVTRGKAASGAAFLQENRWAIIKEAVPVPELLDRIKPAQWSLIEQSPIALLHARATTKGTEKREENNHPVTGLKWIVTHNGTLSNDNDLFTHFKEVTRWAEVDTAAINLVLSRGTTWVEAISGIGTLTGTAALAAVHRDAIDTVLLARWNDKPLTLSLDNERKIIFWASEAWALPMQGRLAGLPLRQAVHLPERCAVLLSTTHGVQRYRITPSVYAPVKPVITIVGQRVGFLAGSDHIVLDEVVSAGIPTPEFGGVTVDWHGDPPGKEKAKTNYLTGYGTWHVDGAGVRTFSPMKKIKHYWKDVFAGVKVRLPADHELAAIMDGLGTLERMYLKRGLGQLFGLMCPWCGVMETYQIWQYWKLRCAWCGVRNEPAKGHLA